MRLDLLFHLFVVRFARSGLSGFFKFIYIDVAILQLLHLIIDNIVVSKSLCFIETSSSVIRNEIEVF